MSSAGSTHRGQRNTVQLRAPAHITTMESAALHFANHFASTRDMPGELQSAACD